jgi:hypothetical protein
MVRLSDTTQTSSRRQLHRRAAVSVARRPSGAGATLRRSRETRTRAAPGRRREAGRAPAPRRPRRRRSAAVRRFQPDAPAAPVGRATSGVAGPVSSPSAALDAGRSWWAPPRAAERSHAGRSRAGALTAPSHPWGAARPAARRQRIWAAGPGCERCRATFLVESGEGACQPAATADPGGGNSCGCPLAEVGRLPHLIQPTPPGSPASVPGRGGDRPPQRPARTAWRLDALVGRRA